ncbi:MAG TPA: helix-turn-helix domain-containing protein [bacterium]|nr:helix-turn-helix domain-containing protein [bacterium]
MTQETITLTPRQQQRAQVLTRFQHGALDAEAAAQLLGVSIRHVHRLRAAVQKRGLAALAHGNCGRESEKRLAATQRTRILTLARTTYAGW